MIKRKKAR